MYNNRANKNPAQQFLHPYFIYHRTKKIYGGEKDSDLMWRAALSVITLSYILFLQLLQTTSKDIKGHQIPIDSFLGIPVRHPVSRNSGSIHDAQLYYVYPPLNVRNRVVGGLGYSCIFPCASCCSRLHPQGLLVSTTEDQTNGL